MLRLTIGIPSYNEGGKIISLIKSVCESALSCDEARIIEVIVCDHSSDSTPQFLASFMAQQRYPMIRLVHHDVRGGVASAWNEIFSLASGDIVVLFDADVLPLKDCISELVLCMDNNQIGLCASNPICRNPNSSAARAASFISSGVESIRKRGVSQYTVMGRSLAIRADLAKRIIIPKETIAIDLFLQCRILVMGYDVLYWDKAKVFFTPPYTLRDFASQVLRSRNGHRQISARVRRLGINASPWSVLLTAVKTAYTNPADAIFMLLCSCLLPFYRSILPGTDSYKWAIATSTKG
jgi:cellulose synthase/poly-beta-1,6-N-acetylglucosamine synthase-like glycosyltransferase